MNIIKLKQFGSVALAAIIFAACSKAHMTAGNSQTNVAPNANVAVIAGQQTNANRNPFTVSEQQLGEGSPTECVKAYVKALKNTDADGLKRTLSSKSLEMIAIAAKKRNKSLDEFLKMGDGTLMKDATEFRNEQIKDDAATVEAKASQHAAWIKIPLVKENAEWRVAIDKMLEELGAADMEGLMTNTTIEPSNTRSVSRSKTKFSSSSVSKTITIAKSSNGSVIRTETTKEIP
jgi:sulfite reductase alpha subunit-like flavoprotein